MPENKGVSWRKKIHSNKPKDVPSLKSGGEDTTSAGDFIGRRRPHGWRKPIQESRPWTPVSGAQTTIMEGAEDTQSERSETSTPRRNSRPRLARYTTLFSSFKESSKGPDFAEPWSADAMPSFRPYSDPLIALQSIRSHMVSYSSKPLPLEHNNGLLRIFEDYGKVKDQKEHLENLLQRALEDWKRAEYHWTKSEQRYEAEIRRLDLLIAQGTSGMTGLIKARQGSIVDRKKRHRRTRSIDRFPGMDESLSPNELDRNIKLWSQRVPLLRPTSPSEKMAALSKQFICDNSSSLTGDHCHEGRALGTSYKTQSERKLSSLDTTAKAHSATTSTTSSFSGSIGDPLPDEITTPFPELMESKVEYDAFFALRQLGTLVARRRGLKVDIFLKDFMRLFSAENETRDLSTFTKTLHLPQIKVKNGPDIRGRPDLEETSGQKGFLRRFQSQPQLSSDQRRRRHFSFEPGDDQLRSLQQGLESYEIENQGRDCSDTNAQLSPCLNRLTPEPEIHKTNPLMQTLFTQAQRPSKIPSPVLVLGRVRREKSSSSLQSIFTGRNDSRHNSRSSILTAYRDSSLRSLPNDPENSSSTSNDLNRAISLVPSNDKRVSLSPHSDSAVAIMVRPTNIGNLSPMHSGDRFTRSCTMVSSSSNSPSGVTHVGN